MNARIAVFGSGGNVGSHLVQLLARMPEIGSLVLVDPDIYARENLVSQHINLSHVGRAKVEVQAELVREIRPDIEIIPLKAWLEDIPLGQLRGDLMISCLDSRLARLQLNARVLALGAALLDCGVDGYTLQWQVSFFNAKQTGVCLQCTWNCLDYDLLEQTKSCQERIETTATNATASLGSMAASYIALKVQEFLCGTIEPKQFFSRQSRMLLGTDVWRSIRYQPNELTVAEALSLENSDHPSTIDGSTTQAPTLEVPGKSFHVRLTCSVCEQDEPKISLFINHQWPLPNCPDCGGVRFTTGDDLREELTGEILDEKVLAGTLADIGLRPGEVIRKTQGETVWHFELPSEHISKWNPIHKAGDHHE